MQDESILIQCTVVLNSKEKLYLVKLLLNSPFQLDYLFFYVQ